MKKIKLITTFRCSACKYEKKVFDEKTVPKCKGCKKSMRGWRVEPA